MSRTGRILCLVYALIIIVCLALAYTAGGDFKGQFIFLQLPIVIQMAAIDAIGLSSQLKGISWVGAYAIFGLPTFVFLYFVGSIIDGRSLEI